MIFQQLDDTFLLRSHPNSCSIKDLQQMQTAANLWTAAKKLQDVTH